MIVLCSRRTVGLHKVFSARRVCLHTDFEIQRSCLVDSRVLSIVFETSMVMEEASCTPLAVLYMSFLNQTHH
jgi:hypothetical protein